MIPKRVVLVDDSRVFRSILEDLLKDDPSVQVVASLWSGEKALEYLSLHPVDVVTLDVEMPGLDGIETLRRIQELNKGIGVIMLSSLTRSGADATMRALDLGAFDFLPKPSFDEGLQYKATFRMQLLSKIKAWRNNSKPIISKQFAPQKGNPEVLANPNTPARSGHVQAIVIGVSTGGPKALTVMLPLLTALVDCPILIVQHMPPHFTKSLAESLAKRCRYKVVEASEGQAVEERTVYIAPGGFHLVVRRESNKVLTALTSQPAENGCRPSVDVLFRSAGNVYGANLVAMILTGMGADGAASLRALKRGGAWICAQDEASSVVWGMPGSAVATGVVDDVASLEKLPESVAKIVKGNK